MADKNAFGGTKVTIHVVSKNGELYVFCINREVPPEDGSPMGEPCSSIFVVLHCKITTVRFCVQAVAGVQRRTWDKDAAAARQKDKDAALEDGGAQEKARKIREKPVERNPLSAEVSRAGAGNTDYMKQIGKVKMATAKDASKDRVGAFYCPVTQAFLFVPCPKEPQTRLHREITTTTA